MTVSLQRVRLRVFAFQLYQHHISRLTLNQRRDLAVGAAEDQVSFPVCPGTARSSTEAGRSACLGGVLRRLRRIVSGGLVTLPRPVRRLYLAAEYW